MNSPHTTDQKPLLVLVPHYVASMKYFEKLLPYLLPRYRVLFLLLSCRKSFRDTANYRIKL